MGIYHSSVGTRLRNYLQLEGLTVEDFAVLSPKFVRYIRNLGRRSEQAVFERLEELGLEAGKYEGQPGMPWYKVVPYYKEHREEIRMENPIVHITRLNEETKPKDFDWSAFRREVSRDILLKFAGNLDIKSVVVANYEPNYYAAIAVDWADALIHNLQEGKNE